MRPRIGRLPGPIIHIPRGREVALAGPSVRVRGIFEVDLVHIRTGLIAQHLKFYNTVTDAGLNALMDSSTSMWDLTAYCGVGTGTTAPTIGDTALQAHLARTNYNGGFPEPQRAVAADYEFFQMQRVRVFTAAQANGNLTEVGFFKDSTGGPMWCRQQFKDANGNPTTIVKTSEYELRITYTVRCYPVLADTTYSATVNGAAMDVLVRPSDLQDSLAWAPAAYYGCFLTAQAPMYSATHHSGAIGTTTGKPGGTATYADAATPQAYTAGSHYREFLLQWNASSANGTIRCFRFGYNGVQSLTQRAGTYQHQIATPFTKTNTERLDLYLRAHVARF